MNEIYTSCPIQMNKYLKVSRSWLQKALKWIHFLSIFRTQIYVIRGLRGQRPECDILNYRKFYQELINLHIFNQIIKIEILSYRIFICTLWTIYCQPTTNITLRKEIHIFYKEQIIIVLIITYKIKFIILSNVSKHGKFFRTSFLVRFILVKF